MGKASIESFVSKYDLIIHVADVSRTMMPFQRILWGNTKGTADLPQVQTYINCYDKRECGR